MMWSGVMQFLGGVGQSGAQAMGVRFYFDQSLTWES